MVSTRSTKSRRIVQGDPPPGDGGDGYEPEKVGSGSTTIQGPKSGEATSKQKGKQPEKRRKAGKLSKLPDMPLDVLYEVSYGIKSIIHGGAPDDNAFGDCRYSLSFTRRTYCGCRGPARPFVMFSQASPRDRFGYPLSTMYPRLGGHLRVLMN